MAGHPGRVRLGLVAGNEKRVVFEGHRHGSGVCNGLYAMVRQPLFSPGWAITVCCHGGIDRGAVGGDPGCRLVAGSNAALDSGKCKFIIQWLNFEKGEWMPTALITGITGQDGSYLAELLLSKGYRVIGVARRSSTVTNERIEHLLDDITVVQGDLHDQGSLLALLEEYQPSEVYNLAAQSFVPTSWNQPALTGDITALGVTRILEAVRFVNPKIRFYQASSSEMFGRVLEVPQHEIHSFLPAQPLWCCEGIWALDHSELSRVFQYVCRLRYFVQP